MYLWTEFEGATIDSSFALTKLLQAEGRSAFFSTLNAGGEPVLIRIIECHFDEDEILARWRGVQALGHESFLRIDRFGKFEPEGEEGITAVYAVFEPVEANLAGVLEQGRLSAADAAQIGLSVVSALETLHANGFVHEHIETRNIYAVGDSVKLRSDCIRESPEGDAGAEARRSDVQALGVVLTQVLLGGSCDARAVNAADLPAPFDQIVRRSADGSWGVAEIMAVLGQAVPSRRDTIRPESKKAARVDPSRANGVHAAVKADPLRGDFSVAPDLNERSIASKPPAEQAALPLSDSEPALEAPRRKPGAMELPVIFGISDHDFRSWSAAAAVLLGVVLIGWLFLHYWLGHGTHADQRPDSSSHAVASTQIPGPAAASGPADLSAAPSAAAHARAQWRVVAFTYRREEQAQKKASSLAQSHPALSPAVFSPTGRAPWLVTIGGVLDRDSAYALARKAPSLGLPRDTYAQNYKAR